MNGSSLTSPEDYDALSVSDITFNEGNADILRQLKDDSPNLSELVICGEDSAGEEHEEDFAGRLQIPEYAIEDARGMGVLGHYLGRSTTMTDLYISLPGDLDSSVIAPFLVGLGNNKSIQKVHLHLPGDFGDFFRMLSPFIKGNPNLTQFHMEECRMDAEQYRSLSSALREGNSLKEFTIGGLVEDGHYDHEESIIANIEALKVHPQLEHLLFRDFSLGRNAYASLSDLLRHSSAGMKHLALTDNAIDDSGLEILMGGLVHCSLLERLFLIANPAITGRGWRALAALLEDPNSCLQRLFLHGNDINDEGAIIFANALARNNSLQWLYLHSNVDSTGEGWKEAFSKLLCDTSSVNNTFLSNHALSGFQGPGPWSRRLPDVIATSLRLNEDDDKRRVALRKILMHHDDFDMQPLFEWDLKVLPLVVEWCERAASYGIECEARTRKRKIAAIYQFVRGMPELAIEGIVGMNKKSVEKVGGKRPHSACE